MTKPFGTFAVAVLAVAFLAGPAVLPMSAAAAGRDPSGASRDFSKFLSDSKLPSLYLAELKRLCLEGGDLSACRECAKFLEAAGRSDEVVAFADSLASNGREFALASRLIKSYGLFGEGDWAQAIGVLDSLIALLPPQDTMAEAVLLRSECQLNLGLADEARLNLEAIESRVGSDQRLVYLVCRGRAEEASGDMVKATSFFQAAWKDGSADAGLGLLRCDLRGGKLDAGLALEKEFARRETRLPSSDACGLAAVVADAQPGLWQAIMKPLIADTAFDVSECAGALASIVRSAEAGQDVAPYCDALLGGGLPDGLRLNLRYALALHYQEPGRAAESLAVLAREVSDPRLKLRCLSACLAKDPERGKAVAKDLGTALRPLLPEVAPDERLALARALIACGAGDAALGEIARMADALKAGADDEPMAEIADLELAAGDTARALQLYQAVSMSPVPSATSLKCERRAFMIRHLSGPKADIAKEVEKIAKKGASDLELGDLFMEKLRDYERAAVYFRRALGAAPEGAGADQVKLKLARSLALASLGTGADTSRAEALGLVASLARSKSVKPEDVLDAVKTSSLWLDRDATRTAEVVLAVSSRTDLASGTRYGAASLLLQLFAEGAGAVYDQCAALLTGLVTESSKQAPAAALGLARLKFLAGDYAGAREAFALCAGKSRDPILTSISNRGIGKCCIHSGGMAAGLEYLKRSGTSQETCYLVGRCYEVLGEPDSSLAYYRAGLDKVGTEAVADRLRLRLGLVLTARDGLDAGRGALDSPLVGVRDRLREPRLVVTAYALDSTGYEKLAGQLLEGLGAGSPAFACEVSLLRARLISRTDPAAARQLALAAGPGTGDIFDGYAAGFDAARYACSLADPGACVESRQEFKRRFPLDEAGLIELEVLSAVAVLDEAPSGATLPSVDSLVTSGVKHPAMPGVLYRRGVRMLVGGDYEGAEKMFRLIVDGYPGCDLERDACFKLGSIYYLAQKYDASALYYGLAALSTKASLARDALFNYSLALEQAGDFGRAADASRRLAVRFPFSDQFERSLVRAGYCLQSAGRPMEAMRFYGGVVQYADEAETLAETRYWIAECFSDAGDHVRAACEFLRTAYLYPKQGQWSGTASYGAGDECEKAGLADEAIIIYKQNVRTYGKSSDWGKASADRLADLGGRREPGKDPEVKPAKGK